MSGRSSETPSFFKALSNVDYSELLRLPQTFLGRYELNLPEYVKLRVEDSRRRWNVRVEKMDNGLFCFTNGWRKFAEEAALQLGEFLVFSLTARFEFEVIIYENETSCCKRGIPLLEEGAKPRDNDVGISKESNPLYFEKCLNKSYQKYRIRLPNEFSKAGNMRVRKRVRLEYVGDQRRGGVSGVAALRPKRDRTVLSKGWFEFQEANGLGNGKTYSFELKPGDGDVKEVKKRKCSRRRRFD